MLPIRRSTEVASGLARFSAALPGFLRHPIDARAAEDRLRRDLERREERFLAIVDRAIFGQPRSPYLPLLRHAGCEQGDVHRLVAAEGLDGALKTLAQAGVYVEHDEFKGLRDAVRGSARFRFDHTDFDNPLVPIHLFAETGASSGKPIRIRRTLGLMDDLAGWVALSQAAHGLERPRHAFWMTGPVWWALIYGRLDQPVLGWFHPLSPLPWQVRVITPYLRVLGRIGGQDWPRPIACDLRNPAPLARWLAHNANPSSPMVLTTASSAAARVAIAAKEASLDLTGVVFVVKSEPLTMVRRRLIEDSGAEVIVLYGSMEIPTVSSACATPTTADDMHLAADLIGLVARSRAIGEGGPTIDALTLTTLSPNAGKLCLNVEIGDYGRVEERDCGCLLGRLGLRTHLSEVRGFDKLTGEGVTFLRASLESILEHSLPTQFGGTAMDYQLAEEEDDDGITRLVLRVAPSVGLIDEGALRSALLRELGQGGVVQQYMADLWRRAETVAVRREPPLLTRAGKILPFQSRGRVGRASVSS